MSEAEMFKEIKGFNTEYFKVGQLIKVTVQNFEGMFLDIAYGFIKEIKFDKITFIYISTEGELKEKTIVYTDLIQDELNINIEIVADRANKMRR